MELVKRDRTSGLTLAFVETTTLTDDERGTLSDELHELVIASKCGEALAICERGIEAQIEYLVALRGEDAVIDTVLDALDSVDKWRSWK